jgi:hypothetical protein
VVDKSHYQPRVFYWGKMKKIKKLHGDFLFHVGGIHCHGNEMILIPGNQAAQGRGVYASTEPRLQYTGGEGYHNNVNNLPPIYRFPAYGEWKVSTSHKTGEISYNSLSSIVYLSKISKKIITIDRQKCCLYTAKNSTLIKEWDVSVNGRNVFSLFADKVRKNIISQQTACEIVKKRIDNEEN